MINFLKGNVEEVNSSYLILNVNDVGYLIYLATMAKYEVNKNYKLLIHTVYKEDDQYLIGFNDKNEKDMFHLLLKCKGIGPKTALHILRRTSVNLLKNAILNEDIHYLKMIPSLGIKAINQIILELKDKIIVDDNLLQENNNIEKMNEVQAVLRSFGYKQYDIDKALVSFNDYDHEVSYIIKEMVTRLNS